LRGSQPQPVKIPQHTEVAIQVETAFQVEHGRDLVLPVDALDIGCVQRQFDLVVILRKLGQGEIDQSKGLLCLHPLRIIFLRYEDGEEHGFHTALDRARQIELPVGDTVADVAPVIQLAVDHVNVTVEHERLFMQFLRAGRDLREKRGKRQGKGNPGAHSPSIIMDIPMRISRRELLAGAAGAPFLRAKQRPRIAAVTTVFFQYSHTQHIIDRFLEGYGWNGTHHHPPMDLVALYVDQVGDDDLSRDRARRFPSMKIYPTVAEALTLGGSKLAVDGVVLVGEHGKYPRNEKGQTKYPRYEFFQEIVKVFKSSDRTVPVFNDKHLSWNWDWAKQMYDQSRSMHFPLMAGSSLPVTWRTPSVDMPMGAKIREAMCVCYGGVDSYDFHGLETLQCMVERRNGGESGVEWVQAYRGDLFWQAYRESVWPKELVESALCRSHTLTPSRPTFNDDFPSFEDMQRLVKDPVAYRYRHHDGLFSTMLLMNGLVQDFNFAALIDGRDEPFSTQMYLPMPPARTSLANFFSPLVHHAEEMFLKGKPDYPVERTLLTTGLTAAGVESLYRDQAKYETPHLAVRYQPAPASTFWRT